MFDGTVNKKSGIVVINLPEISDSITAPHGEEEKKFLSERDMDTTSIQKQNTNVDIHTCLVVSSIISWRPMSRYPVVPWGKINSTLLGIRYRCSFL